jgi:hypothetical protein
VFKVWQEHRDKIAARIKAETEEKEREECTFRPAVTPHRPGHNGSNTSSLLLQNTSGAGNTTAGSASILNDSKAASLSPSNVGLNASVRLFQAAAKKNREAAVKHRLGEMEEEFKANCTFKPQITSVAKSAKPKYLEPQSSPRNRSSVELNPEYTFTPKTNPVRDFGSMQSYVESNPFERLYRKSKTTDDVGESPKKGGKPEGRARSSSVPRAFDQEAFQAFLKRQNEARENLEAKVRQAKEAKLHEMQASQKSLVNPRSQKLSTHRVPLVNRVEEYLERRRRLEDRPHEDPNCTFRPHISLKASHRRPKTSEELSRGDLQRKLQAQEASRLKIEQDRMKEATFTPLLSSAVVSSEGRLRVISEGETYVMRLQTEELFKQQRAIQAQREREAREMEECSFTPEVTLNF